MSSELPPYSSEGSDGQQWYPHQYPGYPVTPQLAQDGPTEPPERPGTMRAVVRLMWLGAALEVVSIVISIVRVGTEKAETRHRLEHGNQSYSHAQVDLITSVTIIADFVGAAVVMAAWIWMAWKNGQGRPWARIVATVMGGLAVAGGVLGLVTAAFVSVDDTGRTTLSTVLGVVNLVNGVALLALLWAPPSNAFYAASASYRSWERWRRTYAARA